VDEEKADITWVLCAKRVSSLERSLSAQGMGGDREEMHQTPPVRGGKLVRGRQAVSGTLPITIICYTRSTSSNLKAREKHSLRLNADDLPYNTNLSFDIIIDDRSITLIRVCFNCQRLLSFWRRIEDVVFHGKGLGIRVTAG
jgi:hypothetical protein